VNETKRRRFSRRGLLRRAAAATALGPLFHATRGSLSAQARQNGPNRFSAPSDLKITDMRGVTVASNYDYPIIRIDTNQGVYGLGEVFCNDMISQALLLKPFLVGKNPLQIEALLAPLRRFTFQGPSSGGYSAVDIALHDLAGKVYGVPAWRLLGNKQRDRLLIYCDTTGHPDPKIYGSRMKLRQQQGFQFFKMDLYTSMVADRKDAVDARGVATDLGLKYMCEIIQGVRDGIGWQAPLAADHFGRLTVKDAIRYARAFEPYHLAWAEDFISPMDWRGFKQITESSSTPTLTGEALFGLEEGYKALIDNKAVDYVHPDVTCSGGMLECKRIADYAAANGVQAAVHMANSPVGQLASAHFAATMSNFMVLEYHAVDIPWWQDLVTGVHKPLIENGYEAVPDTPGLGIELNEAVVKEHLVTTGYPVPDGYFAPTPMFDKPIIGNHVRSKYPHYDAEGNMVNDLDESTTTQPIRRK
jgi:L-alanine-DL-glutamate epimerase-like enolase superfamily enzyme